MVKWTALLSASLLAATEVAAFSLPGVQMTTYKKSDHLPLFVNSMTSSDTLLPLDYYKLPFCQVRLSLAVAWGSCGNLAIVWIVALSWRERPKRGGGPIWKTNPSPLPSFPFVCMFVAA